MKRLVLLITVIAMAAVNVLAAQMYPATGRVVDQQGQAVSYATVVLLDGTEQVAGMASDTDGRFELKVPAGEYTLQIQYLGYEPLNQKVRVQEKNNLGDFTLKTSATQIDDVVVKGQLIRREADRFIVNVANTPAAIGKDGIQLLESAPGVWIDGDKISINGKTGSKVYVNERELRMEPEQLITYLRSLHAEDILKIEVVPTTGADYDADSSGGIIKITLRKRRDDGIEGSLSFYTTQSKLSDTYNPSGNINYHSGRLNLYASAWGYLGNSDAMTSERTKYSTAETQLEAGSYMDEKNNNGGGSIGAVYELNDRHSIGGEISAMHMGEAGINNSHTDFMSEGTNTRTLSRYNTSSNRNNVEATFNYIWKVDSLGSTLKVLADYTRRANDGANNNRSQITTPNIPAIDSLYRDNTTSRYDVATATLAFDKRFSPRWSLRAGAKYTYNSMKNDALYEYIKDEAWVRNDNQSFRLNYTENIAAAYAIASANLGRVSLVAGLRGEYTVTRGKTSNVKQDYMSLFPNANISYSLTKDGAYSIIAQYARTIERPRFWSLNPQRTQISDYTYQVGNPNLDPSFKNDFSMTLVLKYKYTFTAGVVLRKDEIQQTMRPDADDPDRLCIAWVNYDATKQYYASTNLPFQPTKWWTINANLTYMRYGQRMDQHAPEVYRNACFANLSTTFTLPAKFYIDLSYRYQSRMELGNIWVDPMHAVNAGLKKRFGDKVTCSFTVRNLLDQGQSVGAKSEGFVRRVDMTQVWSNRSYNISVSYNFKSGKTFKRKAVEAGSSEEKSRM